MVTPWPRDSPFAAVNVGDGFRSTQIGEAEKSRFGSPLQSVSRGDTCEIVGRFHGRLGIGCHRLIGALREVVVEIQELRSQRGVDRLVVYHDLFIEPLLALWSGDGVIDVDGGILKDCFWLVGTASAAFIAYKPPLEIAWRCARSRWCGVI